MGIEVGKSYELKNGSTFKCDQYVPDEHIYPFMGKVFKPTGEFDRTAFYTRSGIYNISCTSDYDFK